MFNFIKKWWLLVLISLNLGTYYLLNEKQSVTIELSGGLLVEIIGAIITFILIDRVLKNQEERKRLLTEKVALKGFRFTIIDLLNVFWRMRRAAAEQILDKPPENWREAILSDEAINDYKHLNFLSDAGIHPPITWNNYVSEYFRNTYLPAIRQVIDSYSIFLSTELIEKLEALSSSELFSRIFLQSAHFTSIPDAPKEMPMLYAMEDYLRKTIADLLDLTDMYNKRFPDKPIKFESRKERPLLGTGRIKGKITTYNV